MNEYNNYPQGTSYEYEGVSNRLSMVMKRVYMKMTLALIVTAFVSLYAAGSQEFITFYFGNRWMMWLLFGAQIAIVLGVSGAINRISTATATLLFYLFAVLMGLSMTPIFLVYTGASIAKTFFITAGVFGAMSVYGFFTSKDLSRWGSILIMCLLGLIIVSVVNIFLRSTGLEWAISAFGVLIFIGLTAWDTQQIKQIAAEAPMESVGKLATLGALTLYLDFINLFLYLLRFFGNRN